MLRGADLEHRQPPRRRGRRQRLESCSSHHFPRRPDDRLHAAPRGDRPHQRVHERQHFMIRRSAIQDRMLRPLGYKILVEVLGRGTVGWISEVPYTFRERVEGSNKLSSILFTSNTSSTCCGCASTCYIYQFLPLLRCGSHWSGDRHVFPFSAERPQNARLGIDLALTRSSPPRLRCSSNFIWNDHCGPSPTSPNIRLASASA